MHEIGQDRVAFTGSTYHRCARNASNPILWHCGYCNTLLAEFHTTCGNCNATILGWPIPAITKGRCKPILAMRAWRLQSDMHGEIKLTALVKILAHEWNGPVTRLSDCQKPYTHGVTGYWSVKPQYFDSVVAHYTPAAIGVIELGGRVIEHTCGYRSEIATIRCFHVLNWMFTNPNHLSMRHHLADRYQAEHIDGYDEFIKTAQLICNSDVEEVK